MISTLAQVTIAPMAQHVSVFRLVQGGGWLMVVLIFLSMVAVGVFAERFFYFKRCRMNVSEFLAGVLGAGAAAELPRGDGPLRGRAWTDRRGGAHGDL